MRPWRLATAVCICGAVVMGFELAGSRVMAPAVGTSLTVWTALIGVILASLSAGYWLGGRMADRHPEAARLALLIAAASVAIALTAVAQAAVVSALAGAIGDIRISAPLGALILFAPAAALLGMVTPYAAKLRIRDLSTDGRTVGTLAALSTGGSIAGTFLAGYLLIPYLGTSATLAVLAMAAGIAAFLVAPTRTVTVLVAIAVVCSAAAVQVARTSLEGNGTVTIDTRYQRATVLSLMEPETQRRVRAVMTDPFGIQGAQYEDSDEPVFGYIRFGQLGERLGRKVSTALQIGGAAYTWPRDFLSRNPDAHMTFVEIDPGMTDIARKFFRLTDDPRLEIVHADGRVFLNHRVGPFDAIYLDAFSGTSIPFQLLTREAVAGMRGALVVDGVVIANLIGSLSGSASGLVRAAVATFKTEFDHVYLFQLSEKGPDVLQNVALVASRRDLTEALAVADNPLQTGPLVSWQGNLEGGRVLTDDHAPVELLTIPLLRR